MIYKNSFFSKELRKPYIEKGIGFGTQIKFGIFLALGSFACFFLLQTLTQSVLYEVVPEFMLPSYFSTISVFNLFIFISITLYFLTNYDQITFAEINRNRWYILVSMGFKPLNMIAGKLAAQIGSIFFVYSAGFFLTIFLTSFLKYPLVTDYMSSMYIAGAIDLLILAGSAMAISLIVKSKSNARYAIFAVACLIMAVKIVTGYYTIVSDRALMGNIANLFDLSKSLYPAIAALVVLTTIILTVVIALKMAYRYNFPFYSKDLDIPDGVQIVLASGKASESIQKSGRSTSIHKSVLDTVFSVLMIIIISGLLAFNVMVLTMSLSVPGKEVSLFGTIPYIFKSDTMQPALMYNDLVFFKKTSVASLVQIGDIVLYNKNTEVGIARVISKNDGILTVNIDYYSPNSKTDYLKTDISDQDIQGKYTGRNRWLGVLILFTNTIFGRMLFLLVPVFLIFYYKSILKFIKKLTQ